MKPSITLVALAPFVWACGGGYPEPNERLADAQAAERSARELGADQEPASQLSLKLAQDQIAAAEKAIANDDFEKAHSLLVRAQADAELAIAQAREHGARSEKREAIKDSAEQKSTNVTQGAVQ
jgi:hypothetical protein